MKISKRYGLELEICHRKAFVMGAYCVAKQGDRRAIVLSTVILNPDDKDDNTTRTEQFKMRGEGRIRKRFTGSKSRNLLRMTSLIPIFSSKAKLISLGVVSEFVKQYAIIQQRELAEEIGLKWEPKEGDIIRELSIDDSQAIDDTKPILDAAIDKGGANAVGESSPSEA